MRPGPRRDWATIFLFNVPDTEEVVFIFILNSAFIDVRVLSATPFPPIVTRVHLEAFLKIGVAPGARVLQSESPLIGLRNAATCGFRPCQRLNATALLLSVRT